jgi:tetratricopeptide (TPR) repeat protein
VFAASRGGHDARAAEANAEFIEWLAARRPQVWRQRQGQPISELAGAALDQMKAQGLRSSQMLAFATQSSGMVQQLLSMSDNPDNQPVTYNTLWRLHHRLQHELLLRARDREGYEALLRLQAELAAVPQSTSANQQIQRYYMPGPFRTGYMPQMQRQPEQVFNTDWQATLSSGLARAGEFTKLAEHIEARGSRAPTGDWLRLSEALAAIGRVEDAAWWSHRLAQLRLASMQASDSPQLATGQGRNRWRWRWYGQTNSQSLQSIRRALDARVAPSLDDEPSVLSSPPADDLWELALLDPDVEPRFVGLAGAVGPGWGASATVDQLVSYHEAGDRHEAIIELLERALDFEELMESPRLEEYVRACYATNDYERIERVLAASAERSATLAGPVSIGRLMVLRHQGRDADADRLEQELLADCRVELANPHPIGPALRQLEQAAGTSVRRSYNRRSSQAYGSWARTFDDDVPTATAVARQLGLKYQAKLTPGDLTISRIRQAYDRHGFAGHAARLVELELTGPSAARGPIERAGLLLTRANLLHHAGEAEAARAAALEAEELLMSQVDAFPADAEPHRRLARLYAAKAYGPNHEKRLEAVAAASRLDPAYDPSGRQAAMCLYELGRFEDAWSAYQDVLQHGEPGYTDVMVLYRGGLAAQHCGHPDEARRLLRQALWRDPLHDLAPQAREVIHDE